ncbi:MAG: hypothetical protein G01um10143_319 [Parcubacteria group bacterium Gr01-1014_3]|nr:MAG: hypothetical protein G01um10143_319 [Parcubacteria group bacterium Gr01-1014_3]
MIGWLIFAVVVIAIVGWRVVSFFRSRKIEKAKREKELDRAYEEYYSDPVNIQWQKQAREEFWAMMRW